DRMLASLETRGRFSIQNGKISGSPLASKLLGLLREPNVFELESMDAQFTIRGGAVETSDIALVGKRSELRFSGKTYLDGRLDLHAVVKAGKAGGGAGESLVQRIASGAELKFGIGGTLASPSITPESPSLDIDAKDVLQKGAGEALKLLEKKKKGGG
ncbi:MAG: hypothetical protein HY292_17920, partial [Planctomycetes bacterium]|nr:hypothetical protein [Planctomycetota bacterium]